MLDNVNTTEEDGREINPDLELPGDPALRKELKDGIDEIVNSKIRAQGERDFQSEALKNLAKKVGIPRGKIAKFANWKFKGNNAARKQAIEVTSAEAAYDILFGEDSDA